jgi:hypothetical protein
MSDASFFSAVVALQLREEAELGTKITYEALIRIIPFNLFD